jgi:hypothetical protein
VSTAIETSEILLKSVDVIVERGHHKGGFSHRGAVCVRGAINAVVNGDPDECGENGVYADVVAWGLADHLGLDADFDFGSAQHVIIALGRWNDAPERTVEQVITALRECAASLMAGAR